MPPKKQISGKAKAKKPDTPPVQGNKYQEKTSFNEWTNQEDLETTNKIYRELVNVMIERLKSIREDTSNFEDVIEGKLTMDQLRDKEKKVKEQRERFQNSKDTSEDSVKVEEIKLEIQNGRQSVDIDGQKRQTEELTNRKAQYKKGSEKSKEIPVMFLKAIDIEKELKQENLDQRKEIKRLENRLEEIEDKGTKSEQQLKQTILDQAKQIEFLENQLEKIKDKGTEYEQQMGPDAGSKLTDTCSDIPYLCDQNRPMRLVEKFVEVYENEWIDAMAGIYDKEGEKTAIRILLTIVEDAYTYCQKTSEDLLNNILGSMCPLLKPDEMSQEVRQLCKNHTKMLADHVVNSVQELFLKEQRIYTDSKHFPNMVKYIKKCAQVTWFMIMQDPMVVLDTSVPTNLDLETYKPFTKRGPRVAFLVWPAVYLQRTDGEDLDLC